MSIHELPINKLLSNPATPQPSYPLLLEQDIRHSQNNIDHNKEAFQYLN